MEGEVDVFEGLVYGRRRYKLIDDIEMEGSYERKKKAAEDIEMWRNTM